MTRAFRRAVSPTESVFSSLFDLGNTPLMSLRDRTTNCIALETRYIRYIVVNQQLNPLQISYRPVTPVTPLFINNLACNKPAKFLEPIPHVRIATLFLAGTARRAGLAY